MPCFANLLARTVYGELMTTGAHKPEKPKAKAKTTTKAIEKEEEEVKPNQE